MEKMKLETGSMTEKNIDKIASLFPNCITETLDEEKSTSDKKVYRKAVHFEMLRQMLSDAVVDGDECYEFTWVGKKASIVEANKPIRKTLRPCKEESVNWDTTENLYIEGDNLEVLKLLQESYLGKVKMIYIDPPYNTGNDFIYNDDFKMTAEGYADESGEFDEEGNRMFRNTDSNGRFHSDWCSMIYSRLMLARNLLSDDGVICIQIDDNEIKNLTQICDEVYGEPNHLSTLCIKMSHLSGMKMSHIKTNIPKLKEYILIYCKNINKVEISPVYIKGKWNDVLSRYTSYLIKEDEQDISTWKRLSLKSQIKSLGITDAEEETYKIENANLIFRTAVNDTLKNYPKDDKFYQCTTATGLNKLVYNQEEVIFADSKLKQFEDGIFPADSVGDIWLDIGINNLHKEGGINFPNGKKPLKLVRRLLQMFTKEDAYVLDFFSGSATTAHAVMQLNAEDDGHRKFIMVQLPEKTDEKSEAYKAGYHTICEIGKERIRRAAKKIHEENPDAEFDDGFRVFKLDDTNMKDVYYAASEYNQTMLDLLESNIKDDRTDLDLFFGCLLEWGLPLSMPYTSEVIDNCTVHTYNDGDLIACFDDNIPDSVVKTIAKRQPLRAVFRDSSFANSPSKINVGEVFQLLAPDTRVKVI